jgi:hypothetical protein
VNDGLTTKSGSPGRGPATTAGSSIRLVVLSVVSGAVVLVAAQGVQLLLPAARLGAGWALGTRVFGALMVAAGVAWLLRERARLPAQAPGRGDPTMTGLRTAGTVMVLLALLGLFNPPPPSRNARRPGIGFGLIEVSPFGTRGGGQGAPSRTRGGESPVRGERRDVPDAPPLRLGGEVPQMTLARRAAGLLSRVFLFLALVLAVRYLFRRSGARRYEEREIEPPMEPARAFAGLEASLVEIEQGAPGPRGAISLAYARLLDQLAAAGAPRLPCEAPHEHLHRALGHLGIRPQALHRLAGLYVLAQFGDRAVTEVHRAEAARALSVSLADLRAASSGPGSRGVRLRAGDVPA